MKVIKLILPWILLLLLMSCNRDEFTDIVDEDYINFALPSILAEEVIDSRVSLEEGVVEGSELLRDIKPNSDFGVIGYCRAYSPGTNTIDYNSGTSPWDIKRLLTPPEVFDKQNVNFDGTYCKYDNPKKWFTDNETGGNNDSEDYLYSFFAYYPKEEFTVTYPKVKYNGDKYTDAGAPIFTYLMHKDAPVLNDTSTVFKQSQNNDVMLSATYNIKKSDGKVKFDFSHVLTALSFAVNNYSEGMELTVYKIELSGTFWRNVIVDLNQSSSTDRLEFTDTYKGRYVIYDNQEGLVIPVNDGQSSYKAPFTDQFILLVSGKSEEIGYLGDIKVSITYKFGSDGTKKTAWYRRPTSFVPRPGTQYTAQLNYVGNAFVLQFVADNGEYWEEGSDTGITFE